MKILLIEEKHCNTHGYKYTILNFKIFQNFLYSSQLLKIHPQQVSCRHLQLLHRIGNGFSFLLAVITTRFHPYYCIDFCHAFSVLNFFSQPHYIHTVYCIYIIRYESDVETTLRVPITQNTHTLIYTHLYMHTFIN